MTFHVNNKRREYLLEKFMIAQVLIPTEMNWVGALKMLKCLCYLTYLWVLTVYKFLYQTLLVYLYCVQIIYTKLNLYLFYVTLISFLSYPVYQLFF